MHVCGICIMCVHVCFFSLYFILFILSLIFVYGVVIIIIIQKVLIIITLNIGGHLIINEWFGFINKFTHMYHCAVTLGYMGSFPQKGT